MVTMVKCCCYAPGNAVHKHWLGGNKKNFLGLNSARKIDKTRKTTILLQLYAVSNAVTMVSARRAAANVTKDGPAAYVISLPVIHGVPSMASARMAPAFVHRAGTDATVHFVSIFPVILFALFASFCIVCIRKEHAGASTRAQDA